MQADAMPGEQTAPLASGPGRGSVCGTNQALAGKQTVRFSRPIQLECPRSPVVLLWPLHGRGLAHVVPVQHPRLFYRPAAAGRVRFCRRQQPSTGWQAGSAVLRRMRGRSWVWGQRADLHGGAMYGGTRRQAVHQAAMGCCAAGMPRRRAPGPLTSARAPRRPASP